MIMIITSSAGSLQATAGQKRALQISGLPGGTKAAPQLTVPGKKDMLSLQSDTVFEGGDLLGTGRIRASGQNYRGSRALLSGEGL